MSTATSGVGAARSARPLRFVTRRCDCHNDDCFEGTYRMLQRPGAEPQQALTPEEHAANNQKLGGGPTISISADPSSSALWLDWSVDKENANDGDRFTLSIRLDDGTNVELLDTEVSYHEALIFEGTDCELSCLIAEKR